MPDIPIKTNKRPSILGIEVHSDELELLQGAAAEYDREMIETEIEPKFRKAALDFRDQRRSFVCPRKDEMAEDFLERSPPQRREFAGKVTIFVDPSTKA